MWPWEHLVFGYVLFSLVNRAAWDPPISDEAGVAVALMTQVPDLVDKPLSWSFGVVTTGYGPAHSVLVGAPLVALLAGALWTRNRAKLAVAAVVGYGSHLVGDLLALRANGPNAGRLLWPLAPREPYSNDLGFVQRFSEYFQTFLYQAMRPENTELVVGYVAVFGAVVLLWVLDGTPGVRWVRRAADRGL
ncbi:metal-dependent hydrolase [Haloferax sp. KTX1]|uniref:metal-dependent hydrolase n=1 Tax=Haloferax sp. KTX1 TaxID=2600597 RepID=UPI0011DDC8F2|nr:metal-dependent hydrolase [Haloferax sp. KTX1]